MPPKSTISRDGDQNDDAINVNDDAIVAPVADNETAGEDTEEVIAIDMEQLADTANNEEDTVELVAVSDKDVDIDRLARAVGAIMATSDSLPEIYERVRMAVSNDELTAQVGNAVKVWKDNVAKRITDELREEAKRPSQDFIDSGKSFTIWKDITTGNWRWLGVYSNNFIDRDEDIIASYAHKDFQKSLEGGYFPYPELWIWHIPHAIGKSDMVFYDEETGMMVSSGTFSDESIARALSKSKIKLGMSHGMPNKHIRRKPDEQHIIAQYRSIELSVLPLEKAANILTDFETREGFVMPLDDQRKEFLSRVGLDDDAVASFEQRMDSLNQKGSTMGLTQKEEGTEEVAEVIAENAQSETVAKVDAVGNASDEDGLKSTVTVGDLSEILESVLAPVAQKIADIEARLNKPAENEAPAQPALTPKMSVIANMQKMFPMNSTTEVTEEEAKSSSPVEAVEALSRNGQKSPSIFDSIRAGDYDNTRN